MTRGFIRGALTFALVVLLSFLAVTLLPSVNWADDGTPDDLDGDTVPDEVDSDPTPSGPQPGSIRILSGIDGSVVAHITGVQAYDEFGHAVAAIGDVNGDGLNDVLIGAPNGDDGRGIAYVFYGPPVREGSDTFDASQADLVLISPFDDDYAFGEAVAPLYDLDGDSLPDMRVRARVDLNNGETWNRTFAYSGATGEVLAASFGPWSELLWDILLGDLDNNGVVDASDLDELQSRFGMTGELTASDGDLNEDGAINMLDLLIAEDNLGAAVFDLESQSETPCNSFYSAGACMFCVVNDGSPGGVWVRGDCSYWNCVEPVFGCPPGVSPPDREGDDWGDPDDPDDGGPGDDDDDPVETQPCLVIVPPGDNPPPGQPIYVCVGEPVCFGIQQTGGGSSDLVWNVEPSGCASDAGSGGDSICLTFDQTCSGALHVVDDGCSDDLEFVAIRVDLSIDSDNTNGTEPSDGSTEEENIENEVGAPGKFIVLSNGDVDGDAIPDFADGFNIHPNATWTDDDESDGKKLVPVKLTLEGDIDWSQELVVFEYDVSDPNEVEIVIPADDPADIRYRPAPGKVRLWTKAGSEPRDSAMIQNGGDFVGTGVPLSPALFGINENGGSVVLWLEAVAPSEELGDIVITATTSKCSDQVRATSFGSRFVSITDDGIVEPFEPLAGEAGDFRHIQLSHPTPVIDVNVLQITNVRPSDDYSTIVADVQVAGTITDKVRNLKPDQHGTTSILAVHMNGEGVPFGGGGESIVVQWAETGNETTPNQPYDYIGSFNAFAEAVEVQPGWNTVRLLTSNQYGLTGFAEQGFEITPIAPADQYVELVLAFDGDPYYGETATATFANNGIGLEPVTLTSFKPGTYRSADWSITVEVVDPELIVDPLEPEAFVILVFHYDLAMDDMAMWVEETGDSTLVFDSEINITEELRPDWRDYEFAIDATTDVYASTGGDFNPFFLEVVGLQEIADLIEGVEIGGQLFGQIDYQGSMLLTLRPETNLPTSMQAVFDYFEQFEAVYVEELDSIDLLDFVKGVGTGFADTGIALVTDVGALGMAGWYLVSNYNIISVNYRLITTGSSLTVEDQQRVAVAGEALQALASVALEVHATLHEVVEAVLLGDEERLNELGEQYKFAFELATELIELIKVELVNLSEFDKGRIVGRLLGEATVEAVLAITTAGIGNAAKKSATISKLLIKLPSLGDAIPAPVLQKATELTDFVVELSTTKMCFVAGTLIHSATGLVPIEEIQAGDLVLSRDLYTGSTGYKEVLDTFVTHPDQLYRISYAEACHLHSYEEVEKTIIGTGEHPFYVVAVHEFVPMRELHVGDQLLLADGVSTAYVTDIHIERGPPSGEAFTTYNFEVADWHTYFVGETGVWVHNVGRAACEKAFSIWRRFLARDGNDYWKAYESTMARLPETLNAEVKLRIFNEARRGYFADAAGGIEPPWHKVGVQNLGQGGSSTVLGQNLEAIAVVRPQGNVAAHHIVAQNDIRAVEVRAILQQAGVDIDEAANGLFLPKSASFADQMPELGPPHTMLHTNLYYETLNDRLSAVPLSEVRDELQKIASELIAGEFPW